MLIKCNVFSLNLYVLFSRNFYSFLLTVFDEDCIKQFNRLRASGLKTNSTEA